MPGVTTNPTTIPGQVNLSSQPATVQKNLRQMAGEVMEWNPDIQFPIVYAWINNAYRALLDERLWYGCLIRGQVTCPQVYSVGTASFTNGQNTVTGVGTNWASSMVNMQIRAGLTTGWYNIQAVTSPTSITLDLPWGQQSMTSTGYQIAQSWVKVGPNIKYILEMLNQRQGYRLFPNLPQSVLNEYDTWRSTTGWTFAFSNKEPSADGQVQIELYPTPTFQQAFPYLAYIQPPDLTLDAHFPVTFLRSDVLVNLAIAEALVYRGPKVNRYYDAETSKLKRQLAMVEIEKMKKMDDNLYMKDLLWNFRQHPFSQYGSQWLQSHAGYWGETA